MSKIDITPIEESETRKRKEKPDKDLSKEINALKDAVKELIILQSKQIIQKENPIQTKPEIQPQPIFDTAKPIYPPFQPMPQQIPQQQIFNPPKEFPKKKSKIKFFLYPLLFILSGGLGYTIVSAFFEADSITKIGIFLGTGFFVTLFIGLIFFFMTKMSNKGINYQFQQQNMYQEFADIKKCPLCNSQIAKSQIYHDGFNYKQLIKCLNPICDFKKEINPQL